MKKLRIAKVAAVASVVVLVTIHLAGELAAHHVHLATNISAVTSTLILGLILVTNVANAGRTKRFACPAKNCRVAITASGATAEELTRLKGLATDHSQHDAA